MKENLKKFILASHKFVLIFNKFMTLFASAFMAGFLMALMLFMLVCLVAAYGMTNEITGFAMMGLCYINPMIMKSVFDREFSILEALFPVFMVMLAGQITGANVGVVAAALIAPVLIGLGITIHIAVTLTSYIASLDVFDDDAHKKKRTESALSAPHDSECEFKCLDMDSAQPEQFIFADNVVQPLAEFKGRK